MTTKYECHATIEGGQDGTLRTSAYSEFLTLGECEKFYLELGHNFYANDEIKHSLTGETHSYWLNVDDKKSMLNYVRTMAKNADIHLNKSDNDLILFALAYMGANIEDANLSGLTGSNS